MSDVASWSAGPPGLVHALLDAVSVPSALLAADGRWLRANPSLACLLAAEPAALAGGFAHREVLGAVAAQMDAAIAAGADGGTDLRDVELALPGDTGARQLRLDLQRLPGSGGAWLLQLRDVTELRTLQQLQETLAFGISHELRAPVRAIEQFSRRLEARADTIAPAEAQDHLLRIRKASAQAGGLIDGLLETIRASRAPRVRAAVDVSMLAEWVGAELQDAEPGRATEIQVAPGLWACGDEHALKQMLGKLFDNAWRFSAHRDAVRIAFDGERLGDRVRLRLRDQGRGFDMRYADRLFVPFRRLHGVEEGAGHGLGLAIAQRIAQAHGGHIQVQAEPDVGATFTIELPAVPDEDASRP